MIYHVLYYCVAVYHDQMNNTLVLSCQPDMLWHKAEAIRLLNQCLSKADGSNLDVVICTIMYLTGLDLEQRRSEYTLLFRGHRWQATWPWVDGQKVPVKAHVDGLQVLVAKRGGSHALQMPGLALSIASADLVYASLRLDKPRFPSFWTLDGRILAAYQEADSSAPQTPASGLASIAGMLPFDFLDVLVNIARTERLVSSHPHTFELSEYQLEAARCVAHHQLLSLPAWNDTDGIYGEWADETIYECCRLSAILFSNAVIVGLPPHVDWHIRLCAHIRRHLEHCDMEELSGDAPGLLLWIVFVACMAACGFGTRIFLHLCNAVRYGERRTRVAGECRAST